MLHGQDEYIISRIDDDIIRISDTEYICGCQAKCYNFDNSSHHLGDGRVLAAIKYKLGRYTNEF
jgi:hypothetical protein